jgi:hypothetical protein
VFAAPRGEAAPVAGVGTLRVDRPLLPRVDIARAGFGVIVDVTGGTDDSRGGKVRKRLHTKGGVLIDQAKEMLNT